MPYSDDFVTYSMYTVLLRTEYGCDIRPSARTITWLETKNYLLHYIYYFISEWKHIQISRWAELVL